jgi:hypothetical protein
MADHIEARMNFIIEQQAQFATDIQLLKERQDQSQRMIDQLVDVTMSLARHAEETDVRLRQLGEETDRRLRELAESGAHTDRRLDALIEVVDKTEQELRSSGQETDRRLRELAESGAHTDRRLDALIDTVDRFVRRNGP